jgi:ribosome-binding protein aMBF1 (putative translation factor)
MAVRQTSLNTEAEFLRALGDTLRVSRVQRGLSRRKVAIQVETDVASLRDIEEGHAEPDSWLLVRLGYACGLTFAELWARTERRVRRPKSSD